MRVVTKRTSTIHSLIIAARNADYVIVYECNKRRDGVANSISLTTLTYAEFIEDYKKLLYFSNGTAYSSSLDGKMYLTITPQTSIQVVGNDNIVNFKISYSQTTKKITATATSATQRNNIYDIALYGEGKNNVQYDTQYPKGSLTTYYEGTTSSSFSRSISLATPNTSDWQFFEARLKINNSNTFCYLFWFITYGGNSSVGN